MDSFEHLIRTIFAVLVDIVTFTRLCLRPTTAVAAENLFLRKPLSLFVERQIQPPTGYRFYPIHSGPTLPLV